MGAKRGTIFGRVIGRFNRAPLILLFLLLSACGKGTKVDIDLDGNVSLTVNSNIRSVHYYRETENPLTKQPWTLELLVNVSKHWILSTEADPDCHREGDLTLVQQMILQSLLSAVKVVKAEIDGSSSTPSAWINVENTLGVITELHLLAGDRMHAGDLFVSNGAALIDFFESTAPGLSKVCE